MKHIFYCLIAMLICRDLVAQPHTDEKEFVDGEARDDVFIRDLDPRHPGYEVRTQPSITFKVDSLEKISEAFQWSSTDSRANYVYVGSRYCGIRVLKFDDSISKLREVKNPIFIAKKWVIKDTFKCKDESNAESIIFEPSTDGDGKTAQIIVSCRPQDQLDQIARRQLTLNLDFDLKSLEYAQKIANKCGSPENVTQSNFTVGDLRNFGGRELQGKIDVQGVLHRQETEEFRQRGIERNKRMQDEQEKRFREVKKVTPSNGIG